MKVIIGRHSNCNDKNLWQGEGLIEKILYDVKSIKMHNMARDYIIEQIIGNLERNYDISHIKI